MQDKTREATSAPGSRRGLYLIPLILTLAILGAWVATGHETMPPTAAPERLLRVETRVATLHETYAVERAFVGRVEAARSSDLGFELAGLVDQVQRLHRQAADVALPRLIGTGVGARGGGFGHARASLAANSVRIRFRVLP